MFILLKMAVRNILRNSRRNFFSVLSIASGLAFLFWIQSILLGHNRNMIETVTGTFTGHAQIHEKSYLEDRQIQFAFVAEPALIAKLNSTGAPWTRRVYFPAIISSGMKSFPVILVGIDGDSEAKITHLKDNRTAGEFIGSGTDSCSPSPVYLSDRLKSRLGVQLGDKIVFMGQDSTGALGNDLFRVTGTFDSQSKDFDQLYAFTSLTCARQIAAIEGDHEIILKADETNGGDQKLRSALSGLPGPLSISTWRDIVPGVANMIKFNSAMSTLITLILFSVITLGVVSSILMNIFERVREIGIMLAIGTTPGQVRLIIFFESTVLALLGAIGGTALGYIAIRYHQSFGFDLSPFLGEKGQSAVGFNFKTVVYPLISVFQYLKLVGVETLFVVIAGIYPALKASRLNPVEIIRG